MAMQALREGASGGILKFFLLGILVLAGGGLVFTDVGGFFRGGVSGSDVAKVGKETVSINTFDRVARRTLARLGITPAQAYNLGYMNQILDSEIRRRLLIKAADDANILVDKDYVVEQIRTILEPAIQSGVSPEDALSNLLRQQGITESELTTTIISERTIGLFGDAMQAGALEIPFNVAEKIYEYDNEKRTIRYIEFKHDDYTEIEDPSEEQLIQLYEATKEGFATPETRSLSVTTINTDNLAKTIEIDEKELRSMYDDNIDLYDTPETRTVEQALFDNEESANTFFEAAKANGFAKAESKGSNIPAKEYAEEDLLDELREPIFSATKTGVTEPIETPLGWTVANISKITKGHTKTFDEAKAELREELVQEQLIDEIYQLIDEVDEFFATGGSLDDAQKQFALEVKSYENVNRYGQNNQNQAPLQKDFGQDSFTILESAYEMDAGTTGPAFEIANGDFIVVTTNSITEKSYPPFETRKDDIKTKWLTDQRGFANRTEIIALQKQKADIPLDDIAKEKNKSFKTLAGIQRNDEKSPLQPNARASVFGAKKGEHFVIETKQGIAIAEVTDVVKPKKASTEDLTAIATQTEQDMQNELLVLYLNELQEKYPKKINERLLQTVYGEQANSY